MSFIVLNCQVVEWVDIFANPIFKNPGINKSCWWVALLKFWFQTDLERENSASYYRRGKEVSCFCLSSPWSPVGHALCPILMLRLVKIGQVCSCGKFMQHLETGLPIAKADRVLCRYLVMFLTVLVHWMYKIECSWVAIKILLLFMAGLFIGCLVEIRAALLSHRESDFRGDRYRFSPCLMRKRVEKSQTILTCIDGFRKCISTG